jgi:hypothetical protein
MQDTSNSNISVSDSPLRTAVIDNSAATSPAATTTATTDHPTPRFSPANNSATDASFEQATPSKSSSDAIAATEEEHQRGASCPEGMLNY